VAPKVIIAAAAMQRDAVDQPSLQAKATRRMAANLTDPARIADATLTAARIDARSPRSSEAALREEIARLRAYVIRLRDECRERRLRAKVLEEENAELQAELIRALATEGGAP
jgi:hypothetical protein